MPFHLCTCPCQSGESGLSRLTRGGGVRGRGGASCRPAPPVLGSRLGAGGPDLPYAGAEAGVGVRTPAPGGCSRPPERPPGLHARPWRRASGAGWAAASWCQVRGLRGGDAGHSPECRLNHSPSALPKPGCLRGDPAPPWRCVPTRGALGNQEARLRRRAAMAPKTTPERTPEAHSK